MLVNKERIFIAVEKGVKEKITKIAKREQISNSELCRRAIDHYILYYNRKYK